MDPVSQSPSLETFYRTPFVLGNSDSEEELEVELSSDEEIIEEIEVVEEGILYPLVSTLWSYATSPFTFTASLIYDYTIDGKHPCKQAKYHCVLQEIYKRIDYVEDPESETSSPLQKYSGQIIDLLNSPSDKFSDGNRTKHRQFLKLFREALESKEYMTESLKKKLGVKDYCETVDTLQSIAHAIYNVRLHSFLSSVMTGAIKKGLGPEYQGDIHDLSLEKQRQAIIDLPQSDKAPKAILLYNCLMGYLGIGFDPHLIGNLPHQLFDLEIGDQRTRFIRTGTPTIDDPYPNMEGTKTQIAPEFSAFLQHCHHHDKRVIYFNLQSATVSPEGSRTEVIKRIFEEEGFEYFGFDHDSDYYNQDNKWESLYNAAEFKESILNQFLYKDPNFWMPDEFRRDKTFIDLIRNVLDEIHKDIFFAHAMLDRDERQNFIDIAYSLIIFSVVMYAQPDYAIIACKDAVDRAGKAVFILNLLIMIYMDDTNPEMMHDLMVMTMGPPFNVKRKELIQERWEHLHRVYKLLSNPRVVENLKLRGENFLERIHIITHRVKSQEFDMEKGVFLSE